MAMIMLVEIMNLKKDINVILQAVKKIKIEFPESIFSLKREISGSLAI